MNGRTAAIESTEELLSRLEKRGRIAGVNVCGYLRTESGVGEAARRYIRALESASIPLALSDLSAISGNRAEDRTLVINPEQEWFDLNLICVDIELHYAALHQLGEQFLEDRYNIALWWWEQARFPKRWFDRFAYYDEIWVGTNFIADTLAPVAPIPVVHMPLPLSGGPAGSRERGRAQLAAAADSTIYLFVFDFHSHIERKNPLAVIAAFKAAFGPRDRVQLVIKCTNGNSNPAALAEMRAQAEGHPIAIHEGYWPAEQMRDLLAACDAYVSLHRSEGAGLPIADALAAGKPVIATGWSGNMDFMNVTNSFPVRYHLEELARNVGPYRAGELWAEPSIDHAAELMRQVYGDREEAQQRARAAQTAMERDYSAQRIGQLIQQRLRSISLRRQLPELREAVHERYRSYQQLPARIREIAARVLPPTATVVVVSKGDDELLKLNGRTAWHFPQNEQGAYSGHYPADSAEAIAQLEALEAAGAQFLLFPCASYWWLDHYGDLARYLEARCHELWADEFCTIYQLAPPSGLPGEDPDAVWQGVVDQIEALANMEESVREQLRAVETYLSDREERDRAPARQPTPAADGTLPPLVGEAAAISTLATGQELRLVPPEPSDGTVAREHPAGSALRKRLTYQQSVAHIQELARLFVPREATVMVVSKGDDELLKLGRPAWHFPRQEDGAYAGYYPATGNEAIEHLEALRSAGAEFLILPSSAFWWLDHYAELQEHLARTALWIHKDELCVIYRLPAPGVSDSPSRQHKLGEQPLARARRFLEKLWSGDHASSAQTAQQE